MKRSWCSSPSCIYANFFSTAEVVVTVITKKIILIFPHRKKGNFIHGEKLQYTTTMLTLLVYTLSGSDKVV